MHIKAAVFVVENLEIVRLGALKCTVSQFSITDATVRVYTSKVEKLEK